MIDTTPRRGGPSALNTGMLVMTLSSVLFSAMSLLIPLTKSVSTSVIASARFVTGIVVILGLSALGRASIKAVNKPGAKRSRQVPWR